MRIRFQTVLFFLLPQIILLSFPYVTADLGFWVALGRDMIDQGQLITNDTYSVLVTKPMIYPSWGISIIYGYLDKIGGLELIFFFHRCIFLVFQILIFQKVKAAKITDSKTLSLLLLSLIGASFYCDRPAMIAILYFAVFDYLVKDQVKGLTFRKSAGLLLLIIMWSNTHGSVFFSYIYLFFIAVYDIGKSKFLFNPKNYLIIFFIVCMGVMINPFGYLLYPYALDTAIISRNRLLSEWAYPVLVFGEYFVELTIFFIVGIYVNYRYFLKYNLRHIIHPVFLTFLFGLIAYRNIIWFFLTFLVYFKSSPFFKKEDAKQEIYSKFEFIFTGLLLIATLSLIPPIDNYTYKLFENNNIINIKKYHTYTPYSAVEKIIENNTNGTIFNELELGSYLIYRLANKNRIFIDGRNIIYSNDQFKEYLNIMLARNNFKELLLKYNFDYILIKNRPIGLNDFLKSSSEWNVIYESDEDILFLRKK